MPKQMSKQPKGTMLMLAEFLIFNHQLIKLDPDDKYSLSTFKIYLQAEHYELKRDQIAIIQDHSRGNEGFYYISVRRHGQSMYKPELPETGQIIIGMESDLLPILLKYAIPLVEPEEQKTSKSWFVESMIFFACFLVPIAIGIILSELGEAPLMLRNSPLFQAAVFLAGASIYIGLRKKHWLDRNGFVGLMGIFMTSWTIIGFLGFGFIVKSWLILLPLIGGVLVLSMISFLFLIGPKEFGIDSIKGLQAQKGFWFVPEAAIIALLALMSLPALLLYYTINQTTTFLTITYIILCVVSVLAYLIWYYRNRNK